MLLTIDGIPRPFVLLKDFRAQFALPATFGVALFEPKDYTGLGSIERAGAELNIVRQRVLDALPSQPMTPQAWLAFLPQLTALFQTSLYDINPRVGLRDVEIEFAVAGFNDALDAYGWALLRAQAEKSAPPGFMRVYADWLNTTVRVSQRVHEYTHQGQTWRVQIITHAYGRAGLIVQMPDGAHYVADGQLACPAEGYMAALLSEAAARMTGSDFP